MCSVLMHIVFLQWTGSNQGVFIMISMDWQIFCKKIKGVKR